ncbi:hypothetical protein ACYF6T_38890 [Streptomyces sp. 7R007]
MSSPEDAQEAQAEEAMAQALNALGFRTMTTEQWSRQGALDAIREQRRRNTNDPRVRKLEEVCSTLADRLTHHVDVPAADMATVLLVAGASVGELAIVHGLPGVVVSEIFQVTAAELDERARGGEQS